MIIVEGPDGAGKSAIIALIAHEFHLPVHKKASDSKLGPVNNLMQWAYDDVVSQPSQPLAVYDRHPLISEYIYAPVLRTLRPEFTTPAAHNLIRLCARQTFVVWCDPGYQTVLQNTIDSRHEQMSGVRENIHAIYHLYRSMRMFWPGQSTLWNYHIHAPSELYDRMRHHIASFQMIRSHDIV